MESHPDIRYRLARLMTEERIARALSAAARRPAARRECPFERAWHAVVRRGSRRTAPATPLAAGGAR